MSDPLKKNEKRPEGYSPQEKPALIRMADELREGKRGLAKNVLPGIPPLRYGDPSAVCYIGSVLRMMEYLRDPVAADELFALSGAGLCFPWLAQSNCDEISIIPELPQRTFAALGYESEYFYEPQLDAAQRNVAQRKYSKQFYMEKIKESIDSGRPVLGFGMTHENYSCLVTGYSGGGRRLHLRAYWSPKGSAEGYDTQRKYYDTAEWYENSYGILVVGEKTGERLMGEAAYRYICETAALLNARESLLSQGKRYAVGTAAFDAIRAWLLRDADWEILAYHETFLAPGGLLLLEHYRHHLGSYLMRLDAEHPGVVHPRLIKSVTRLYESIPGAHTSRLWLHECADPALSDFSRMQERPLREKVAEYVAQLREMDQSIFDCLLG